MEPELTREEALLACAIFDFTHGGVRWETAIERAHLIVSHAPSSIRRALALEAKAPNYSTPPTCSKCFCSPADDMNGALIFGFNVLDFRDIASVCREYDSTPSYLSHEIAKKMDALKSRAEQAESRAAAAEKRAEEAAAERDKYLAELELPRKSLSQIYPQAGIWNAAMVISLAETHLSIRSERDALKAKLAAVIAAAKGEA